MSVLLSILLLAIIFAFMWAWMQFCWAIICVLKRAITPRSEKKKPDPSLRTRRPYLVNQEEVEKSLDEALVKE